MYAMTYNNEKHKKYEAECEDRYHDAWCYEQQYDFKKLNRLDLKGCLLGPTLLFDLT